MVKPSGPLDVLLAILLVLVLAITVSIVVAATFTALYLFGVCVVVPVLTEIARLCP